MQSFTKHNLDLFSSSILINGYKAVYYPEHPNAFSNGYVTIHRLVAENKVGRYLKKGEVAHHKDSNKLNNVEENIEVLTAAEHAYLHRLGALKPSVEIKCKTCGVVFRSNKHDRKYCSKECSLFRAKKAENLTKEKLQELIYIYPMTKIGDMYNISDRAVSKRCAKWGIATIDSIHGKS